MVRLTHLLRGIDHKKSRFLDSIRLFVKGGPGGTGFPRHGGIGGRGGDVVVRAVDNSTLKHVLDFHPKKRVTGKPGENSSRHRILGRTGEKTIVEVPAGVSILTDEGRCLGDLNAPGQEVTVAKGGAGGNDLNQYHGQKCQGYSITLDLKLIADIGFVGFPNAGKSTLLKALSRASPKIASYAFTTLRPNIGIMKYDDLRQISLADLPGLVEGAHINVGLGHKFLKHVERTKMLMFVVDVQGFALYPGASYRSPFETVMLLNRELELYEDDLVQRPAVLVVTKMDTKDAEQSYETLCDQVYNSHAEYKKLPPDLQPLKVIKFDKIIPVCSHTSYNIPLLKEKLRSLLDLNDELQRSKGRVESYSSTLHDERTPIALV